MQQNGVNLSLERPINHNNDLSKNYEFNSLVMQSPNSSETNSSINSLDQTLRLRIGGTIPKGIMN
jgi:outer membrane protein assembly factor BamA